ncbi:MAG: GNAT family N-acetyltransferase [Promethearchaeota archaeon]
MTWEIPEEEGEVDGWMQLRTELSRVYNGEINIVWPKGCDDQCFHWFQILEEEDFRFELRYTRDEIIQRQSFPDVLFFFVMKDEIPEILVLGYRLTDSEIPTFYLDTLAVRQRGRGIGHIIMEFLIKRARKMNYEAIILDTEEKDEKNIPLQHFYQVHGFETIARTERGDLTMKLDLNKSSN